MRYRGREIDTGEVNFLRQWIAAHPELSRWKLQRHAAELTTHPAAWMPWNYRESLARPG